MKLVTRKNIIFIGMFNLFCIIPYINLSSLATEINISNEKNNPKELTVDFEPKYIIDSEDVFFIGFYGLKLFSNNYKVNREGFLFLPDIGYLYARGLTIDELKKKLEDNYEKYIQNPDIVLKMISTRPITVSLIGEINRPGLYTLKKEDQSSITSKDSQESSINYPIADDKNIKLFSALQQGFGLTNNADLRNIQVIREVPLVQGGGKSKTIINLLKLLEEGDQDQNITLYDKDIIIVSKTNIQQIDQLLTFYRTNLYPEEIEVFINGNIKKSGRILLKPGTSLMEALSVSGGRSFKSGKIEFIRLSRKGKNDKRLLSFDTNTKKGSYQNPILLDGDIVYVRKNLLGKTSEVISEYGKPIIQSYGLYKIFD